MLSDYYSGLLTTNTLPEAIHLKQWPNHKPPQHDSDSNNASPENNSPGDLWQPAKMLQQYDGKKQCENNSYSIQTAPYQEVLVVLPDKSVECMQYVMLLLHSRKNNLQKYKLFSNL